MNEQLITESLAALSVVRAASPHHPEEDRSSFHWMLLEIFVLVLRDASPELVFEAGASSPSRDAPNAETASSASSGANGANGANGTHDVTGGLRTPSGAVVVSGGCEA